MIVTNSIREPMPDGAIRGALQTDGSVHWYMPDDDVPLDPPSGPPAAVVVTAQQFRDRFTDAELAAMLGSADMGVKLLVLKIQTADPFEMSRPSVQQGLDYLVSKGILTAPRRAVIGSLI